MGICCWNWNTSRWDGDSNDIKELTKALSGDDVMNLNLLPKYAGADRKFDACYDYLGPILLVGTSSIRNVRSKKSKDIR